MKDPKKQQAEGAADKLKGKAKEAYGAVTNDTESRLKGQKDQVKGEIKKQVGKAREDAQDEARRRERRGNA